MRRQRRLGEPPWPLAAPGYGVITGKHCTRVHVYLLPVAYGDYLNEEVAYKRGLGRPEMKFIYAKSKHGGTNLVHNHRVRRACMAPRPY